MSYLELAKSAIDPVRSERADEAVLQPCKRPATCAPSCYETEPGRWIHHPWDGCTTTEAIKVEAAEVEAECWHCGGEKVCRCFSCAVLVGGGPGRWQDGTCTVCYGTGTVRKWLH